MLPGIRIAPSSSNKVRKLGVVAGVPLIAALCGVPGIVFKVMMHVWHARRESDGLTTALQCGRIDAMI